MTVFRYAWDNMVNGDPPGHGISTTGNATINVQGGKLRISTSNFQGGIVFFEDTRAPGQPGLIRVRYTLGQTVSCDLTIGIGCDRYATPAYVESPNGGYLYVVDPQNSTEHAVAADAGFANMTADPTATVGRTYTTNEYISVLYRPGGSKLYGKTWLSTDPEPDWAIGARGETYLLGNDANACVGFGNQNTGTRFVDLAEVLINDLAGAP